MLIPMIYGALALGGAFDLHRVEPRKQYDIFNYEAVKENMKVTELNYRIGFYQVVDTFGGVVKSLDVDPVLALRAMDWDLEMPGYGDYFHKVINRRKQLEVLLKLDYTTVHEYISTGIEQGYLWRFKLPQKVGTHFVNLMTYGGELIISLRFKPRDPKDLERIREQFRQRIGSNGTLDNHFFEQLDYLVNDHIPAKTLEISAYSTTGMTVFQVPETLAKVKELVDKYPSVVASLNGGKGLPKRIGMETIYYAQFEFPEFEISLKMQSLLADLLDKYDDLRVATKEYQLWRMEGIPMTQDQERTMRLYESGLEAAQLVMKDAIDSMNIAGDVSQFEYALIYYNADDKTPEPYKYTRELERLIDIVEGHERESVDSNMLPVLES